MANSNKNIEEILFSFKGANFYKGKTYKINNKMDLDAPKSWRDKGLSKAPRTGDSASCPYSKEGKRYDTGFEIHSPRYKYVPDSSKSAIVKGLQKSLVKPYIMAMGLQEDSLGSYNKDFWDKFVVLFDEETTFNTSDPVDAMKLYVAVCSGRLVPKDTEDVELEGHPYYSNSSYIVYSDSDRAKVRNIATSNKYEAIGSFNELLKSDEKLLREVMLYIQLPVRNINGKDGLLRVFDKHVTTDSSKTKAFIVAMNKIGTDEGLNEIKIFSKLKEVGNALRKINNRLYYNDIEIGKNMNDAAKVLSTTENKQLVKAKNEILGIEG